MNMGGSRSGFALDTYEFEFPSTTPTMRKVIKGKKYRNPSEYKKEDDWANVSKMEPMELDHIYLMNEVKTLDHFDKLSKENKMTGIARPLIYPLDIYLLLIVHFAL